LTQSEKATGIPAQASLFGAFFSVHPHDFFAVEGPIDHILFRSIDVTIKKREQVQS
jgi:hypothetical protein